MKSSLYRLLAVVVSAVPALSAFSCNPIAEVAATYAGDLQPPRVLRVEAVSAVEVVAFFDEELQEEEPVVTVSPSVALVDARAEGTNLVVRFLEPLAPGEIYTLEATVEDRAKNSTGFVAGVYGLNEEVPDIIISEFTPRGSSSHPDMVELFCRTSGNLAGVTVMEGSRSSGLEQLVFPSVEVAAGDYLVVHFRPEGLAEEINEVEDPALSGGIDADPGVRDFWVPAGDGLSGNNGAVTVYASLTGTLLDAVIYSNRTSDSDDRYRGFGTRRVLDMVDEIFDQGGWHGAGALIAPEDAVNPEGSTATRSICRGPNHIDTNSAADWHIVPTRGATFGGENSSEEHVP